MLKPLKTRTRHRETSVGVYRNSVFYKKGASHLYFEKITRFNFIRFNYIFLMVDLYELIGLITVKSSLHMSV